MTEMKPAPENGAAKQGAPTPGAGQASPAEGVPASTQTADPVQDGAPEKGSSSVQHGAPAQGGAPERDGSPAQGGSHAQADPSVQVAPAVQPDPSVQIAHAVQPAPAGPSGQDGTTKQAGAAPAAEAGPAQAAPAQAAPVQTDPAQTGPVQAGRPAATAVAGPFTARDVLVFGSVLFLFVASLLPMFGGYNLWNLGSLFFLGLGIILPVTVAGLFVTRRLQPQNPLRIGSLSVDQFASVVASFSVALYFLSIAVDFSGSLLLGLVGSLGLLAGTVLAPHIPVLCDDFKDRSESTAHVVARDAVAPFRKPAAPKTPKPARKSAVPAPAGPVAGAPASGGPFAVVPTPATTGAPPAPGSAGESRTEAPEGGTPAAPAPAGQEIPATMAHPVVDRGQATAAYPQVARTAEPIGATVDPASRPEVSPEPVYEAFWFAVPQSRVAVDEHSGAPAFTIEPGGWVLALEDRGGEFLVQNTDGRLGVLRDLSHIERG
ncbi:hypothetical protein [Arthrobacter celericrescens]|uniref:hypothetical protein n=1 Tax=Arthrobacter celericrescens TaxID=2320851 RepID=UPI001FE0C22A|nr:hypothetical protein [Arthrobacter celericrescens]